MIISRLQFISAILLFVLIDIISSLLQVSPFILPSTLSIIAAWNWSCHGLILLLKYLCNFLECTFHARYYWNKQTKQAEIREVIKHVIQFLSLCATLGINDSVIELSLKLAFVINHMKYITLIDLYILKNPCIPGINPTWSWCIIL